MQQRIRAAFIRGGSSKGVFFRPEWLPEDPAARDAVFCAVLGSPDPFARQLNGLGGGLSSLSKVVVVAASDHPGVDLDYTFGQVAVTEAVVDYAANCGNLSAAVGPFALACALIDVPTSARSLSLRLRNTNTDALIDTTFAVEAGQHAPDGDFVIAGVAGSGSRIDMRYLDPAGALTSGLLPSGHARDVSADGLAYSIVDATAPVVIVDGRDLGMVHVGSPQRLEDDAELMARLDRLRRDAGVAARMAPTVESIPRVSPKIAIVTPPTDFVALDGGEHHAGDFDIGVQMISMAQGHRAVTLTGAMCLAAATQVEGTVAHAVVAPQIAGVGGAGNAATVDVRIGHPSGRLLASVETSGPADSLRIVATCVPRTARLLMEGHAVISMERL